MYYDGRIYICMHRFISQSVVGSQWKDFYLYMYMNQKLEGETETEALEYKSQHPKINMCVCCM